MGTQWVRKRIWRYAMLVMLPLAAPVLNERAHAFALLGPYADWMDVTNGFRQAGDIGGPMDIKEGYRWNVPVVTYGFDQGFLDYFGSNGVNAVESALAILNSLPPASEVVLTNFPTHSERMNYWAEAHGLYDLKSVTLSLVLEQMGLAEPERNIYALRRWDPILYSFRYAGSAPPWPTGVVPNDIIERNFDPTTLGPTNLVNGVPYGGFVSCPCLTPDSTPTNADVLEYIVDPLDFELTAVADNAALLGGVGGFYTGLTADDIGGVRYLLSTNNQNFECLLPGVQSASAGPGTVLNGAVRPGVEKITFVRHPFDARIGSFLVLTNVYTDTYLSNNLVLHQELQRVVGQPDFLFCAADLSAGSLWTPYTVRSGTRSWSNNAAWNGDPTRPGPGVISPPVAITFHKLGAWVETAEPQLRNSLYVSDRGWGSFDGSTNLPVTYPAGALNLSQSLVMRFRLRRSSDEYPLQSYTWHSAVPVGGTAVLQSSTNLVEWESVYAITNRGAVIEWTHDGLSLSQRFFRLLPQ